MQEEQLLENLRQKYAVYIIILSLVCNIILAIKLYTKEATVVMVPTIHQEMSVGTEKVSNEYLLYRAEQIMQLLFNTRQENYTYNTAQILRQVSSEVKAKFAEQLAVLTEDIKSKHYFYVFHKNSYAISDDELEVTVSGYLDTFFNNKKTDTQYKTYRLTFINNTGLVHLRGFEELKENQTTGEGDDKESNI